MLLAGDIGGTKTGLAIISPEAGPRRPLAEATFPSAYYPSLEALVGEFLDQVAFKPEWACLGVAGPVISGQATVTNLPWVMSEDQLQAALGLSGVRLLNDLVAIGNAVPWLGPDDLLTLNAGQIAPGGTLAVIAPGTGLGETFLTWDGVRYRAYPSEGGHADFAPANPFEAELLLYLQKRFEHVSYERVCAGIGIPNIYYFLRDGEYAEEPDWLADQLGAADDPVPVIIRAALDTERPCPLCAATLDMFVSILGSEAGNMALKVLATGGVYLGGGIPPRILPALQGERFMQAFSGKGRMSVWLARVPVHVILNPKVAILGAAYHGLEMISHWEDVHHEQTARIGQSGPVHMA